MTTSSSTESTESAGADTDAAPEIVAEIVPELVEEDFVEGVTDAVPDAYRAEAESEAGSGSVVAAGAAAVAAAGLGLTSMGGSWLGTVLGQRQQLLGQIATSNSSPANQQLKAQYLEPWHRVAFVSLGFAIAAIFVAGATLFLGRFAAKAQPPVWVRAVALGALALGVIGLGVSAAMYFDVFAKAITVPAGG
jgi:hypothetical protein